MMFSRAQYRIPFRSTAILSVSAFLLFSVQGCLSIRLVRTVDQSTMSVGFAAYLKARDSRSSGPTVSGVLSELRIKREGRWELLKRSEKGLWTMANLVPGEYRVQVFRWAKPNGEIKELGHDKFKTFVLDSGESANVTVILEKTPTGLIIVLAITVVVFVAFLVYMAATKKFPFGLPPPPRLPVPPPPAPIFLVYWSPPPGIVVLDSTPPPHEGKALPDDVRKDSNATVEAPPRVIDYGPLDQAENIPLDSKIWLQFSDAIERKSLDHRNFIVELDSVKVIAGGIYYDDRSIRAVYHPLRPLPGHSKIAVKIYGRAMRSTTGQRLDFVYSWSFTTR